MQRTAPRPRSKARPAADPERTRTITFERPWLYPKQYAAMYDPRRYSCIEATTKAGKTWSGIVWLTERALLGAPGTNYWWVAPIYAQAKIAFRRLKNVLPRELYAPSESEQTVTLANGATLWFKGADKPDSLYGEDVYAAVIDEASRVKEDAWHAVRSTLTATRGPIRLIGNVKGRQNWFYRLARRGEAGEAEIGYHKITAHDAVEAGIVDEVEVEDARRTLPEAVFRELYMAEPSDDGGNPFGLDAIKACATLDALSPGGPVAWGWDLAKSVDWTVGVALDRDGKVCRLERFQRPWELTIAAIRVATGSAKAIVDSTGVGDPILEALQKGGPNFHGYHFTAPSKQQLMEGLAVAIQQRAIAIPKAGPLRAELESFEYAYSRSGVRYAGPEGMHDDCVCALALAVHGFRRAAPVVAPVNLTRASYFKGRA